MQQTYVIVGAGQAAAQAVDSLRREGYAGRLVVIGEEPLPPYQRPPLSKKYLAGELPIERLAIKPESWYTQAGVDLRLGLRAAALDTRARELALSDGTQLRYDQLLLATGSSPRPIAVPGADLAGIYTLRTREDVDRIRAELASPRRVVIVGGGYIGLEVAATCRMLGHEVEVIEMTERVMNRVVAPQVSAFYAAEHAAAGVRLHLGTRVSGFTPAGAGRVGAVLTEDGREHAADLVVVGIGVVPVTAPAEAAGLACDNGIAVDQHCRSSDPQVYAAGDCCSFPSLRYGGRVRLESVDNAFEQAKVAAANMQGGSAVHDRVPWFWSDQYDLKLLIVGLNAGYDQVVLRGAPAGRAWSCCYLRDGELLAVDCINNPRDYMVARKLIAERVHLDPGRLAEADRPLREAVV
jgi:3-phenylpropionate/trans-cinnamate dioxygenase ferredoxin reductase subunit